MILMMYLIPGGLAEEVTEKILHAAFIPFGDILDIQIPLDYETGIKHQPGITIFSNLVGWLCIL